VLDLQATKKYNLVPYPGAAMGMAGDSAHSDSVFGDIKVRQAISYAIDNEAIAKAIGFGLYASINQFFDPTGPYYNKSVVGYPYNPQKAKELLAEAGHPNGFETKITFSGTDPDQSAMLAAVQGYLSEVGITAKLDAADPGRASQTYAEGWHNQLVYHWCPIARSVPPGTTLGNFTPSSRYDPKSMLMPQDFLDKYNAACAEPDTAKARPMFQEVSKIIIDQYCLSVPIMAPYQYLAKTLDVQGLDLQVYAMSEWLPEEAWLSK
jgi:ABC-type transport system substrate-binding protein